MLELYKEWCLVLYLFYVTSLMHWFYTLFCITPCHVFAASNRGWMLCGWMIFVHFEWYSFIWFNFEWYWFIYCINKIMFIFYLYTYMNIYTSLYIVITLYNGHMVSMFAKFNIQKEFKNSKKWLDFSAEVWLEN